MPIVPTPGHLLNMADAVLGPPLARGQGSDPAILCDDEIVTYAELDERANRAGNAFRSLGVDAGDRVLMMVVDQPVFFYAYFGLMKIGAVPCALNLRLSPADLAYTIADSGAAILLTDVDFLSVCETASAALDRLPQLILTNGEVRGRDSLPGLMMKASSKLESILRAPDAPGFWMYSSGTTGKPKGVVHAQRTVFAATDVLGKLMDVAPGDRVFCSSKLFFAFSLGHLMFGTLQLGATAVLYPGWPDATAVADVIARHRPTIVLSVPTFYRNMLRDGVASQSAFKDVRYYMSAGEKLPRSLFDRWMDATGRPVLDGIGATETCFLSISNCPDKMNPGTCGVPTPGTEVKLIGEDDAIVTEPLQPGVLWVKLASVANGYWNLDALTEAAFRDGWYCTNDMFTFDADGWYEYQGRADDMLKISGQWVSPAEIEEHVLKHPQVAEAAVVGIANEDGLVRLALFMVAPQVSDRSGFEKELQDSLVASLSIYKCPRRVYYVESMPLTATGKLQRYALRQLALNEDRV